MLESTMWFINFMVGSKVWQCRMVNKKSSGSFLVMEAGEVLLSTGIIGKRKKKEYKIMDSLCLLPWSICSLPALANVD